MKTILILIILGIMLATVSCKQELITDIVEPGIEYTTSTRHYNNHVGGRTIVKILTNKVYPYNVVYYDSVITDINGIVTYKYSR